MSKKVPAGPFESLKTLKKEMEKAEAEKALKPKGGRPLTAAERRPSPKVKLAPGDVIDAVSFERLMSDVKPLDDGKGRIARSPLTPDLKQKSREEAAKARQAAEAKQAEEELVVHERLHALVEETSRFELSDDGRRVEGRRVDLPPDTVRKLRRGQFPIDARIDLHGLSAREARETVEPFLRDKRALGERCVLIVHGKGDHSPRGMGVLRGEIAAWLSQGSMSVHVAAFSTAQEADGGEGAVYVMLRK